MNYTQYLNEKQLKNFNINTFVDSNLYKYIESENGYYLLGYYIVKKKK